MWRGGRGRARRARRWRSAGRRGSGAGRARRRGRAAGRSRGRRRRGRRPAPARSSPLRAGWCACARHQHQPRRLSRPSAIARSASSAPTSWPATSGRGPHVSCRKPASTSVSHSRRVRMLRAVLGVAVQRQVGQHDAIAVRERVHDRLELAVREPLRVQQRQRRPGPGLAVRDPRAVGVVIEPQLHSPDSFPGRSLAGVGVVSTLGQPVRRREDARLLRGRGEFLDDIRARRTLHMAFVRCPHAHARVRSVRGARFDRGRSRGRARSRSRSCRRPGWTSRRVPHPLLADGEVRYVGQPVAAVVAEIARARPRTSPSRSRSTTSRSSRSSIRARASRWCAGRSARATSPARSRRPPT